VIVVDASAMIEVLLGTPIGDRILDRVTGLASRHAPHLLDVEVAQVMRRFVSGKRMSPERARVAILDLGEFPLQRHPHWSLLERVFDLRANLTAYDAVYLALAESMSVPLITCDEALAAVPGARVAVEVVA
jgi:predicted nucleic acid-binding protein